MTLTWQKDVETGTYLSGPFYIRKVEGWRPSTPRRNWVWEPHGPGIKGLPAFHTLSAAKQECEQSSWGIAQELQSRYARATAPEQTSYDHTHITDQEAQLLQFVLEHGTHLIQLLREVK